MRGYQQAPRVHEPKDMRMWGCKDTNKHQEYMNLKTYEGARIRGYQQAPGVHEPKDMRTWGYQQADRVHEPKDKRMWVYEVTSKHTRTWGYEDVRMRGYKQVHINIRI